MQHDHAGHRKRMRERFLTQGLDGFAPHEVLELLLFYAIPQRDVNPLAHELIKRFGSLAKVLEAPPSELEKIAGVGPAAAALIALAPQLARYYALEKRRAKPQIITEQDAAEHCAALFHGRSLEMFIVVALDAGSRVIAEIVVAEGTVDESTVYPRKVVQAALNSSARAVILTHNHPGGTLAPSPADVETTNAIVQMLKSLDVLVYDHIIVADEMHFSFCRNGLLEPEEGSPYAAVPRRGSRKAAERLMAQGVPLRSRETADVQWLDELLGDGEKPRDDG